MEQDATILLVSLVLGALALLFTIIGTAIPYWGGVGVFNFNTGTGALLIIAIVLLMVAVVFTAMFWRGIISNASDMIKYVVLALFIISGIFIVAAYSQAVPYSILVYSYHLTVTAGILTFLSLMCFSFWAGRTSVPIAIAR